MEDIQSYIQSIIEDTILLEDTPYWRGDGEPPKQINNKSVQEASEKIVKMLKDKKII